MSDRKHLWIVQIQSDRGDVIEREVRANWDPDHELTSQSVLDAARIEAWAASGKQTEYASISAEMVA